MPVAYCYVVNHIGMEEIKYKIYLSEAVRIGKCYYLTSE